MHDISHTNSDIDHKLFSAMNINILIRVNIGKEIIFFDSFELFYTESLKIALINLITILMISTNFFTPDLLQTIAF